MAIRALIGFDFAKHQWDGMFSLLGFAERFYSGTISNPLSSLK
jgi:hypothetical protein